MRLVRDTIAFTAAEMPKWNSISVSGYHIREAGSTAAEELAFTLANGFAYVELAQQAGLGVDEVAPRLSFFFNAHIDFFEEIAKYRAARRLWATWMKDHYRGHQRTQLEAALPHPDRGRLAHRPTARGQHRAHRHRGARRRAWAVPSRCTRTRWTRRLALPSEKAARIALRTQQVIAYETNVANVADPLGGSWFVEALTDEMARRGRGDLRRDHGYGRRLDARGLHQGHRGELVPGSHRRVGLQPRAQLQLGARASSSA